MNLSFKWFRFTLIRILVFTLLSTLVLLALSCSGKNQGSKFELSSEVYSTNDGFGYRILNDKKVLIQQSNIPAIQGEHPFSSRLDAEKAADLVIRKILKRENPVVSILELKKLDISIPIEKQNLK